MDAADGFALSSVRRRRMPGPTLSAPRPVVSLASGDVFTEEGEPMRRRGHVAPRLTLSVVTCLCILLARDALAAPAAADTPAGEMRWALYVTISPAWFDPAQVAVVGGTPFWFGYALHDALVKPMPDNPMAPSLATSWTVSDDQRAYEFTLREGLTFHNGDPFTAADVKFTFQRYKSTILHARVREVEIVGPHRVRFHLHQPWPDFMTYYGTLATGAGWIVPKTYLEQVGEDGFRRHPIGLGPYKFVSHTPGVELVMEANEHYWRKVPHVKRLVFKSVPEGTTRLAMLKKGEVDVAYDLDVPAAEEVKRDPRLRLAFSGGIGSFYLDFLEQWDPKSPWHDPRVRLAANYALDREALNEAERLGASPPAGSIIPRTFEFALPIEPYPYDPARAKRLLAEAGYPHGFDAGDLTPHSPYFSLGEAVANYLGAVGIKVKLRTMERAAYQSARAAKQLRGLCVCISARYGNAATRIEEAVVSIGVFAYGGYPDIDELFKQQDVEMDRATREVLLHNIQQLMHERVMFGPIWLYFWPSGIGPRVEEPALMLINPFPWSAPLEDVRLKTG
jgi:peptide/nickel transport system substrate-binding protein